MLRAKLACRRLGGEAMPRVGMANAVAVDAADPMPSAGGLPVLVALGVSGVASTAGLAEEERVLDAEMTALVVALAEPLIADAEAVGEAV